MLLEQGHGEGVFDISTDVVPHEAEAIAAEIAHEDEGTYIHNSNMMFWIGICIASLPPMQWDPATTFRHSVCSH